jgi:hypothetical protein
MVKVLFAGDGTIGTEFLKLEKCPFGRAKKWSCKIRMDVMEGDSGDKTCVGTLECLVRHIHVRIQMVHPYITALGNIFFLRSWDCASLMYSSTTNKMQRCMTVFITINALHISSRSSAHHQELKTVYTAPGICQDFSCFLPLS